MKGFAWATFGAVCLLLVAPWAASGGSAVAAEGVPVASGGIPLNGGEAAVKVPAVPLDGQRPGGGLPTVIHVKVTPGDGDVFLETEPLSEPDFQVAARNAVRAAANATGSNVSNVDVFVSVEAPLASVVEGPSAGAAMAVAMAAALQGREVRSDVAVTGTVLPGGSIGSVGALDLKAQAAAESGASTFVVPAGSSQGAQGVPAIRLGPGVLVLQTPEERPDLGALEAKYDLRVVQAATVEEALAAALVGPDPAPRGDAPEEVSDSVDGGGSLAYEVPGAGAVGLLVVAVVVAGVVRSGRRR